MANHCNRKWSSVRLTQARFPNSVSRRPTQWMDRILSARLSNRSLVRYGSCSGIEDNGRTGGSCLRFNWVLVCRRRRSFEKAIKAQVCRFYVIKQAIQHIPFVNLFPCQASPVHRAVFANASGLSFRLEPTITIFSRDAENYESD